MRNVLPQSLVTIVVDLCVVLSSTDMYKLFCVLAILKNPWRLNGYKWNTDKVC